MNELNNILHIDGIKFHKALVSGIQNVISRQDYLNKINVFPVPDSDTGTNMAFTLNAIVTRTKSKLDPSVSEMLLLIADSALDGARGNSGVILAQFFQGMSDGCKTKKMSLIEFSNSIKMGAEYAREALGDPKEGTILTILTDFSNHLIEKIEFGITDFIELFNSAVKVAEKSLENTPNQLKVLKKAGVVDAGAQGFVDMLHGIQYFIETGEIKDINMLDTIQIDNNLNDYVPVEDPSFTFRYCTECIITGENIDRNTLRKKLQDFGNSLVFAGTKTKIKIHIHTNEPANLFKYCDQYGLVSNQKADDMFQQKEIAHGKHADVAIITDSGSDIPDELIDKYNIHVVPVRYNFGEKGYIDKVSQTPKEFYLELKTNTNHPQTSQPPPGDFRRQYQFLSSHYNSIISIHLPKILSGTYQSAENALNKISGNKKISIVDSLSISGGMGLIVIYAAEAAEKGYFHDEIESLISEIIPKTNVYASVYDLSYSVKGGRIPKIVKNISDLFKINPILTTNNKGEMKLGGAFFGRKNFAEKTAKQIVKKLNNDKTYRIIISHCNCEKRAHKFLNIFEKHINNIDFSYIIDCGSALGVHTGPDSLVIGIQEYKPMPKKIIN